jgi:hypothetical protein
VAHSAVMGQSRRASLTLSQTTIGLNTAVFRGARVSMAGEDVRSGRLSERVNLSDPFANLVQLVKVRVANSNLLIAHERNLDPK